MVTAKASLNEKKIILLLNIFFNHHGLSKIWFVALPSLKLYAVAFSSECYFFTTDLQILSLLPSYKGKSVLELGAGIGRFTGDLAKEAGHILALDFIESVIKKVDFYSLEFSCMAADICKPMPSSISFHFFLFL